MKIVWEKIPNPGKYVKETLAKEADDIPDAKVSAGRWELQTLKLDELTVDKEMILDHESDELHIKRKEGFIKSIKENKPIKPLIALGKERFLVDGYARYRAMRRLGVSEVEVLVQVFE